MALTGDRAINVLMHEWVTAQLAKIPAPHDMSVVVAVCRDIIKEGDTHHVWLTVQKEPME